VWDGFAWKDSANSHLPEWVGSEEVWSGVKVFRVFARGVVAVEASSGGEREGSRDWEHGEKVEFLKKVLI